MTQLYTSTKPYNSNSSDEYVHQKNQDEQKIQHQINISQILVDFKNTISSIGAPSEIEKRVNDYIAMVEVESNQHTPRKETIITHLKTASKLLDDYISQTLKKPSNVVQDWIDAFLLQEVDYKADAGKAAIPASKQIESQMDSKTKNNLDNQYNSASAVANYNNYHNQIHSKKITQPTKSGTTEQPISTAQNTVLPQPPQSQETEEAPRPRMRFVAPDGKIHQGDKIVGEKTTDGETKIYTPEESAQKTLEAKEEPPQQVTQPEEQSPTNTAQPPQVKPTEPKNNCISKNSMVQNFYEKAKQYLEKGDASKALESYKKTLNYAKKNNDKQARAYIIQGIGESYDDLNNIARAAKCFNRVVHSTKDTSLKAIGHNSLGEVYDNVGKFDLAMDHYFESLSLNGEVDNPSKQAQTLNNIGKMHNSRYMSKEAIDFYKIALDLAKQNTPDIATMGSVLNNTATAFKTMNKPQCALKYYQKSIVCANKASDKQTASQAYEQAADLMMDMKKFQKAHSLYKKAMQEALNSRDTEQVKNIKNKMDSMKQLT